MPWYLYLSILHSLELSEKKVLMEKLPRSDWLVGPSMGDVLIVN